LCAGAASVIIIVNATFLQSGTHPAPFFANPTALTPAPASRFAVASAPALTPPVPIAPSANPLAARPPDHDVDTPARAAPPARTQGAAAHRNDPIADLIGTGVAPASTSSVGVPRILAIQRVLSEFGYGQMRLTGTLDEPTSTAIRRFEAEHQLPVTGRVSDRLMTELAAMTGRPVQ
jgi:Putative peptidoglycan binding domain